MDGNQTFRRRVRRDDRDDMVVVEIASGKVVEGSKKPRPIRQRIWRFTVAMPKSVACAYPLAPRHHLVTGRAGSPCWGTTHADYFYGAIPCTRQMTQRRSTASMNTRPAK